MIGDPRQSGIALVMALLLVALLATLAAGLATTASVESVHCARESNDLQHELAVDSAIRWFVRQGAESSDAAQSDERWLDLVIGDCMVRCRVVHDAAKLNVTAFDDDGQQRLLERKLSDLARRMDLPDASVNVRPAQKSWRQSERLSAYLWFDQLFVDPDIGACFRDLDSISAAPDRLVWSDALSLWGDGRVDVRFAPDEVLRVLLADVDRGAAEEIIKARNADKLTLIPDDLPERVASQVTQRLTTSSDRFALTIATTIHSDRRTWYVVTDVGRGQVRKIHYRGQVQW